MPATSKSTKTVQPTNTQCGVPIIGGVTQPATSNPIGSLAPTSNAHLPPLTNVTGSRGTTVTPSQPPLAQPVLALPSIPLLPLTSSTQGPSAPQTRTKSKKLSHLFHISAATWIGVGLALGALVAAVYYGAPMWRLARWTALNDFRASCISDHDRGLEESAKCMTLLAAPAKPPPVVKRTLDEAPAKFKATALWWTLNIAVPIVTLLFFLVWLKGYAVERQPLPDSVAKSDVNKIHKYELETGQTNAAIPAWSPKPAHEHDEWNSANDHDHDVSQTGADAGDTASEADSDDPNDYDELTRLPAVNPYRERNGSDLSDSDQGLDETLKPSTHRHLKIGDIRYPRQPTWVKSTIVEQEPVLFDGSVSALNLDDGTGTKDLRMMSKSNHHLRAIRVPVDHGTSTCRLTASRMFTENERKHLQIGSANRLPGETKLHYEEPDPIVWRGKIDARARVARRLGLRGQRDVYLILDHKFVEDVCWWADWTTEFEWEGVESYKLTRRNAW
jgi:hypothetical protein